MTQPASPAPKSRILSARRVALLATVAGLGLSVLLVAPQFGPKANLSALTAPAYAQNLQKPAGFADIVEKVKPAVISVRVKVGPKMMNFNNQQDGPNFRNAPMPPGSSLEQFFRRFGMPDNMVPNVPQGPRGRNFSTGQGSGFFISADGFAVTNNHVVARGESVEVATDDGQIYSAKVIGTDPRTDLALIKVDGRTDFPFVRIADKAPRIGDWVIAVGNPFGLGGSVTAGIVSARGRDIGAGPYDDFIQIDAPVNKGNSGGPTFDTDGNVIGVNTAIFSPSGGSVGIAFAIPAETVRSVVAQLKDHGAVTRGWLGVQIQTLTPELADSLGLTKAEGALVADPQANSPAEKAGIKAGDVIATVDGEAVKDARALSRTIGRKAPGTSIKLGINRKGKDETITLKLGEMPKDQQLASRGNDRDGPRADRNDNAVPRLGLGLAPASSVSGAGSEGLVITEVDPNGPAAERGLKTGDVILEVGGMPVKDPREVRDILAKAKKDGKKSVLMRVKSGSQTKFVALPFERA
jgi:serine protease Do